MLKIILGYLIIFIIMFSIFGLAIFLKCLNKNMMVKRYLLQFICVIVFLFVYSVDSSNIRIFNFNNLISLHNFLLIFLGVFPTALIAFYSDKSKPATKFTFWDFLDGAGMEIVQRLLAQNLLLIVLTRIEILTFTELSVLLNGLLWVQFILIQEIMNKRKVSQKILLEIVASFWFSISIGILYVKTGNLLITMLCHGLERYFTYFIRNKYGSIKNQIKI